MFSWPFFQIPFAVGLLVLRSLVSSALLQWPETLTVAKVIWAGSHPGGVCGSQCLSGLASWSSGVFHLASGCTIHHVGPSACPSILGPWSLCWGYREPHMASRDSCLRLHAIKPGPAVIRFLLCRQGLLGLVIWNCHVVQVLLASLGLW